MHGLKDTRTFPSGEQAFGPEDYSGKKQTHNEDK